MPRRGSSKPPAEPVVKPYGCDFFRRHGVKKKLIIVFVVIAVILLLIPIKKVYEDGGTQTYTSLIYKVIVWKQIDGKTGMEFYIFPKPPCPHTWHHHK